MAQDKQSKPGSSSEIDSQRSWRRFAGGSSRWMVLLILGILVVLAGLFYFVLTRSSKQSVQVVSFAPLDEVPQTTNFTIEFSRYLAPDSLLNVDLERSPITFEPPIPGKSRWIESNKLRFYPDVYLAPSTQYIAKISTGVISGYGYSLKGEREFHFHTPRFRVNSAFLTYEFQPETPGQVKLVGSVEFNYEVEPEEAVKYIAIEYEDGQQIPFEVTTTSASKIIRLEAEKVVRREQDVKIHLKITPGLVCVGGNLGLEREFVEPLIVPGQRELKVITMQPRRESPQKGYVQIQFNLPIDSRRVGQFITLEPPINYQIRAQHNYLELRGDFKMGTTYRVTLRKGLRAIDGSTLPRDFYSSVTFRKERIPPQIDFVGEGFYLTRQGNLNLGLSTINVDKVILEVEKIFANNLTLLLNVQNLSGSQRYYGYYPLRALGKRIHQSEMVIQMVENQEVVTPIPVKEFLADERIGIFNFTARQKEQRWNMASKWVVATDLGILAKEAGEDLWVWVNSLSKLQPVQNAEVKLISQNNQTLMTATTDAEGLAIFRNYKQFTDEFVPYLITVALGQDLSFLELQRRRVPTSDFDVGGAPYLQQGYQAFVYNERDIYRPGETAHLAAIVRGENLGVPVPFPVILTVRSPDGKILTEQKGKLNDQGGVEFSVPIPDYAMTGRYFCILLIGEDEEIGRTFFNVEEFIPDRMKVTLITSQAAYFPGDTMQIMVEAVTLFGPPAAGRRVEAELDITPQFFSSPPWRSFRFYDEKKSFSPMHEFLGENRLDESGKFTYTYKIPENLKPPSALQAKISATVTEPGGRGVTDMAQVTIHPYSHYVGLRKAKEGYATPSEETWFEYVTVNPQGQPIADRNLEVEFYRVYWHSILKRMGKRGRYRYVSEKVEELIQKFNVVSQAGIGRFSVTPDQYGKYLVVVRDVESGASSSVSFYASGWGYAPWAMDHPDRLELDLDKSEYQVGETARVQVRAPFSGKLFLTLEREKIFEHRVLNLEGNTATLEIRVPESYKPNVYVSAHLIRSTESLERDTPARAFGVTPLMVNSHANRLNMALDVPDEIRPNSTLKVKFQVKGQKQGRPYVTVAAVDEGICQLTDFQSPDPHAFFFSKKRLEVASFDIYGMILPEIESSLSSAAGGITEARRRHLIPVSVARVKPVAFWSGLLKTDRRGRGQVSFDIPQFNGTLRIMAVAFVGDQFGSATKNLFVREPLVLTPTLPRFISSTDLFQVPVNIYNATGKEANIEVHLKIDGPATIQGSDRQSIKIPKDKERLVTFTVKAEETTGKVTFHFTTQGGGAQTKMQVEVPLRPPVPFTTLSGNGVVEEGKPATFTLPGDWLSGTTDFTLTVSSFPAVQFAGSLQYLLRYPYGCIEQTTSRVFPLLYFDELARVAEPELFKNNSADYYIQEGIARLESMQLVSGAFTYWPVGGYINTWSSVYASHFLVEARRAGYAVSDRVYNRLLDALHNYTRSYRFEDPYSYQTAVYACYVLALAGKLDRSTMLYFKNNVLDRLPPFSRYQLAGAFALAGDLQTARSLLPRIASPPKVDVKRETGRNFNSSVRAKAIMLDVLAEVDSKNPMVPILVQDLTEAAGKLGRWYNTQENAWAFLALGKILSKQTDANYTGTVNIGDKLIAKFTTESQSFTGKDWGGKEVQISLQGKGTCYYYWRTQGIPAKLTVNEFDYDLQVRRRYLDREGQPIHSGSFSQGELIIAEISLKALNEPLQNVVVVDMLPAGLEIENPRLQSRQAIPWIRGKTLHPSYLDIRDDRLIFFANLPYSRELKFYYGLRAVTSGEFILPPILAEAMYDPSKASVASSGRINVASVGREK